MATCTDGEPCRGPSGRKLGEMDDHGCRGECGRNGEREEWERDRLCNPFNNDKAFIDILVYLLSFYFGLQGGIRDPELVSDRIFA